jgi:hypothetical protein
MKQYLLQLKSQLVEMQEELRRRLIKLATTCDTVEKQLEKRVKVAEMILTFAEMCRKLEAEEEKVLPFYASTLTAEEREEVETAFYEQPLENLAKVYPHRFATNSLVIYSRICIHMMCLKASGNASVKFHWINYR